MARVLKESRSFTHTSRVRPLMEWTIFVFFFPAEAGPHLLTPEGWKAELAWGECQGPTTRHFSWSLVDKTVSNLGKT